METNSEDSEGRENDEIGESSKIREGVASTFFGRRIYSKGEGELMGGMKDRETESSLREENSEGADIRRDCLSLFFEEVFKGF